MNGGPILKWSSIRPTDPYSHILFIAFYPDNVRMFLVSREEMPASALIAQSTIVGGHIFQVHTRYVNDPPAWLAKCEVLMK